MPILLILKLAGSRIWSWLSHASFWQLVAIGLALFGLWQTIQVRAERRHSAKVEARLHVALDTLDRLAKESKAKQDQLDKVIRDRSKRDDAERRAKKVEEAPLLGGCRTSPEVMGADL